jgi:hypothetical protein
MEWVATDEFNSFGPWVDEVAGVAGVPKLYSDYPIDFAHTRLVLKIPRDIPRRDANPTMNLYDALVIVDEVKTVLLSRNGEAYVTRSMRHDSLVAISDSVLLLDGRLVLHGSDGESLLIAYNGSSQKVITRLVVLLRALVVSPAHESTGRLAPTDAPDSGDTDFMAGARDYALVGAWQKLKRDEPAIQFAGAHASVRLASRSGGVAKILFKVRPRLLHGVIVAVLGTEKHILHRRDAVEFGSVEDISSAHTVILRPMEAEVSAHPVYEGVRVVHLSQGRASLEFLVPRSARTEAALINPVLLPGQWTM